MRRTIALSAAVLVLTAIPGSAAPGVAMVKDINPTGGSAPYALTDIGGTLFFSAQDGTHGYELWRSDGTRASTFMVKDIAPGRDSSFPHDLTILGATFFFIADDGAHGRELWKSDGTRAGTVMVKDIWPGPGESREDYVSGPEYLTDVAGTLFFSARDHRHGRELWRSDGTETGTVMVKDINPDWSSHPRYLTNVESTLLFSAAGGETVNGASDWELWKSDGTEGGTVLVKDIDPNIASMPNDLTDVSGTLFFATYFPAALWRSDGTAEGTVILSQGITQRHRFSSAPSEITTVGEVAFFRAHSSYGYELWRSDGSAEGTSIVKDIHPGEYGSSPVDLTVVADTLYFAAGDGRHGYELWSSDGTEAGTRMVSNIDPGPGDSDPYYLTGMGAFLYFVADDGTHGRELWMSDGTDAGTLLVANINPGLQGPHPEELTAVGDVLFLVASDGDYGRELWKSSG